MPSRRKKGSSLSPVDLLLQRGVSVPVPASVEIGPEVDPDRISGEGVVIHAGCKIFGKETLILPRVELGRGGPAAVEDCQIGEGVKLKGGSFRKATFLSGSCVGTCAEVREGCLFEEQSRAAHCVGTKQTILFPFATLGSLVNFCDCLLAGGKSAKNHSEVGSAYIHFNFSPNQDKATPSLIGDVPRGVMLRAAPIFLGGQGGLIGPSRIGYGTVIAAGVVFRGDCPEGGKMLLGAPLRASELPFTPGVYREVQRKFLNNVTYLANLLALRQWYLLIRRGFFRGKMETVLYQGALQRLEEAFSERLKRLEEFVEKMPASLQASESPAATGDQAWSLLVHQKRELSEKWPAVSQVLAAARANEGDRSLRDSFLEKMDAQRRSPGGDYLKVVQQLKPEEAEIGTRWLQGIVGEVTRGVLEQIPTLGKK